MGIWVGLEGWRVRRVGEVDGVRGLGGLMVGFVLHRGV